MLDEPPMPSSSSHNTVRSFSSPTDSAQPDVEIVVELVPNRTHLPQSSHAASSSLPRESTSPSNAPDPSNVPLDMAHLPIGAFLRLPKAQKERLLQEHQRRQSHVLPSDTPTVLMPILPRRRYRTPRVSLPQQSSSQQHHSIVLASNLRLPHASSQARISPPRPTTLLSSTIHSTPPRASSSHKLSSKEIYELLRRREAAMRDSTLLPLTPRAPSATTSTTRRLLQPPGPSRPSPDPGPFLECISPIDNRLVLYRILL